MPLSLGMTTLDRVVNESKMRQPCATIAWHRSRRHDPIAGVGAHLDQRPVLLDTDQRPRVARQHDGRARPEDRVDRAPFEPEVAQVRPRQERARYGKTIRELSTPNLETIG